MKKYLIVESIVNSGRALNAFDVVVFGNSIPIGVVDTLDEAI